jgi:hypothetical protein
MGGWMNRALPEIAAGRLLTLLLCVLAATSPVAAGNISALPVSHVPGPGTGYDGGPQLGPRQLSWAALLVGTGLFVAGLASGHRDLAVFGGLLAPAGGVSLWRGRGRNRKRISRLSQAYDLTHFGEDMRYLFDKHPNRDMIGRSLIRRYPEMHRQFLFSLTAFGPAAGEADTDAAFTQWYQSLDVGATP